MPLPQYLHQPNSTSIVVITILTDINRTTAPALLLLSYCCPPKLIQKPKTKLRFLSSPLSSAVVGRPPKNNNSTRNRKMGTEAQAFHYQIHANLLNQIRSFVVRMTIHRTSSPSYCPSSFLFSCILWHSIKLLRLE